MNPRSQLLILQGVRILVVDDDEDSLVLLQYALEGQGSKVFAAASVLAAKALFTVIRPQLVISDLDMPEADGYSLSEWVRSLEPESGGQVPMVALTAMVQQEVRQQALAAGFNLHLLKPVDLEALFDGVAALLQQAQTVEPFDLR